jgi:pyruvate dehydrogenase E1 component
MEVRAGTLRGMYLLRPSPSGTARVRLLASGTILREALAAAETLESGFDVAAEVYSVTSYTELRREAMAIERGRRFGAPLGAPWVEQLLPATGAPVVAASDYVAAVPDLIRPWVRDRMISLGTDGFGRSDTRAGLRRFFEVDRQAIALAALSAVDPALAAKAKTELGADSTSAPPWSR